MSVAIDMARVDEALGRLQDAGINDRTIILRLGTDQTELVQVLHEGRVPRTALAVRLQYVARTGALPEPGQELPIDNVVAFPGTTAARTFELCRDIHLDLGKPSLVKQWLDHGAASMFYGPPGQAKTFNMLHLSFCVATDMLWFGHKVAKGGVCYFALEGGEGAKRRIMAIRKRMQLDNIDVPFALFTAPVDLSSKCRSPDAIIEQIREAEKAMGQKVVLVIIDTLNRALAGGDENSAAEISGYIANVDHIRHAIGCHVATVHHSGKDLARGARGSNALLGAVDTAVLIDGGAISIPDGGRGKQRDHRKSDAIGFRLVDVEIGHDEDGAVVTSAVVEPADAPSKPAKDFPAGSGPDQILKFMARAWDDKAVPAPRRLKLHPGAKVIDRELIREPYVSERASLKAKSNSAADLADAKETAREHFRKSLVALRDAGKLGFDEEYLWFGEGHLHHAEGPRGAGGKSGAARGANEVVFGVAPRGTEKQE